MYTMAKCAVLLLAVLGYAMFYQKRRLPLCFFPITLVSGITVTLYLAGLAGFLKIGCYALLLPGLLALARYFSLERLKAFLSDQSILFTVFAAVWVYMITRGVMLAHNDDGTHWYRICKAMNYENAYPTTPDIVFYEYVPGCATWIYFLTRFIPFRIDNTMFAQSLLNVSCTAALFAGASWAKDIRTKGICFVLITAAGVLLCSIAETTYALLVDVQVGLMALTAIMMVLECGKESIIPVSIVVSLLALVKNSALLFVLFVFVWAWSRYRYSIKEWLKRAFAWLTVPIMLNMLYAFRSDLIYGQEAISVQGISLERYASLFAGKSAEAIRMIAENLFSSIFSAKMEGSITMYACILLYAMLFICLKPVCAEAVRKTRLKEMLVGSLLMLAVYSVGLFATYLFSMTEFEATWLLGFDRYFGAVLIVIAGLAVYAALKLSGLLGIEKRFVLSLTLLFVLLAPGTIPKRHFLGVHEYKLPNDYRSDVWRTMEIYIPQNNFYNEGRYAILWNENDFFDGGRLKGRVTALTETWLRSTKIVNVPASEIQTGLDEETLAALSECEYVACISDMTPYREYLSEYLGDTNLNVGLREVEKAESEQ